MATAPSPGQPVFGLVDGAVADSACSVGELGSRIVAIAGRLAAATSRWLLMVADFDAREGYAAFGLSSTAQWLEYSCALARRTAVEHLRVARALAAWPRLAEEMAHGRLSYSHVRSISRIAADGTAQLIEDLVNLARHGTVGQVEATVRGLRTVRDVDDANEPPTEYVKHTWTSESQWRVSARLDPERGALVESAIRACARAEGIDEADALVRLAEIGLAAIADERGVRTLRGEERAAIVVHVDAARVRPSTQASTDGPAGAARSAERVRPYGCLQDGPGLPDEVIARLACSSRVRLVVRDGTGPGADVLQLGRSRRLVSARQFHALLLRDGGCTHPGCRSRHGLEAHHVQHWLDGGPTNMANLVLLCRRHHHALHDGEFSMRAGGRRRFRFFRAGRELPYRVDPSALISTSTAIEQEPSYTLLAPEAATPAWDGGQLDHDLAVWGIAQGLDRPGARPAPRSAERGDESSRRSA